MNQESHPVPEDSYIWLDQDEDLQPSIPTLLQTKALAIDTESDNYHAYNSRICLLQLATQDDCYALDTLALSNNAVQALKPILEDPEIPKIIHGADNDLAHLALGYDLYINGLFDTILAARYLNFPRRGLSDLLELYFGVSSSKKFQRFDWSTRPLPEKALEYAIQDVRYLIPLHAQLSEELKKSDRYDAVLEDSILLTKREFGFKPFDPQGFRRINGAKSLRTQQLNVLHALYLWRHEYCTRQNRAAFLVLDNSVLIELAIRQPSHLRALQHTPRLSSSQIRRFGEQLIQAIENGRKTPAPPPPPRPPRNPSGLSPKEQEQQALLLDELRQWREQTAQTQEFELDLIATNATLQQIVRTPPSSLEELAQIPGMTPWRCRRFGRDILQLL